MTHTATGCDDLGDLFSLGPFAEPAAVSAVSQAAALREADERDGLGLAGLSKKAGPAVVQTGPLEE